MTRRSLNGHFVSPPQGPCADEAGAIWPDAHQIARSRQCPAPALDGPGIGSTPGSSSDRVEMDRRVEMGPGPIPHYAR